MNKTIYKVVSAYTIDDHYSNLTDATQRAYEIVELYETDAYVDRFEMTGSWHLKVTQQWVDARKEESNEEEN